MIDWNSVSLVVAALVGLVLLAGAAWVAWKLLRFLILKLPGYLTHPGTWTAWLAVIISLAVMTDFTAALLDTGAQIVTGVGSLLRDILDLVPSSCEPGGYCPSVADKVQQIYYDALRVISGGSREDSLPRMVLLQLPGFIVLAVVINFLLGVLRALLEKEGTGRFGGIVASGARLGTSKIIVNGLFVLLVLVSMYLSLAALLAVPLMQPQAVVNGFGDDDLAKNLPLDDDVDKAFADRFPEEIELILPATLSGEVQSAVRAALDPLSVKWRSLRADVIFRIKSLRPRALEDFRAQNALGLGGKGPVSQYVRTYEWYWAARDALQASADRCQNSIRQLVPIVETINTAEKDPSLPTNVDAALGAATASCESVDTSNDPLPERTKPGDSLKAVGIWTDWLIGTESMPLVIIAGLVGFSLLGASISHLITRGRDPDADDLSLSDFLKVVIKGAVAALTVFLASYGGLAVLGNVPQDPSPYVVFALCLVAAVFSDDVWTWAREKLLGPALKGKDGETEGRADTGDGANDAVTDTPTPETQMG